MFGKTFLERTGTHSTTPPPENELAGFRDTASLQSGVKTPKGLRVVLVAPSLRRLIGGQEVQASLLLKHWQDDPDVSMAFVPIDTEFPRWISAIESVPYLRTAVRLPFYLTALWRSIGEAGIAHIFAASYGSFLVATTPAYLLARLRRRKIVIHYHDGRARDHLRKSRFGRMVLRHTREVVVPSGYLVDVFKYFGLGARIVPNVVDLGGFTYRERSTLQPLFLCTRNFEPHYGVDLVIRGFAEVKVEFPDARLRLVGKGPDESSLRKLVRELQLTDVEFVGPVPWDKIGQMYDAADIFINASWEDNLPGSIIEAFASGIPVVTTAAGGIPYMVTHEQTGLTCEPGDWKALARNAIRLLRDPGLARRLAAAGRAEASRYEWRNVRSQWVATYRS